jgi:GNAT superfamily N-acetyltransferase
MSDITVSTEKVTDELLAEVADLYVVEQYKKSLWAWQFSHRFERDVLAIVARDNRRVVGFNGTMPIKIVDEHDQKIDAIWSCDFIVAPDYRGKGLGKAIKDEMAKAFTMPVMSLGISDSAFPLLLKKGWHAPVRLDVWDLLLRPKTAKQVILFAWSTMCRAGLLIAINRALNKFLVEELSYLPSRQVIDYLWVLHRQDKNTVEVLRDYDYLIWRYVDCPFQCYQFLHVGSNLDGSKAIIIFRISTGNNIEVVDFIGYVDAALVSSVVAFWLKKYPNTTAIHWNTSLSKLHTGLLVNGFVKKSYGSRFATLSAYGQNSWGLVAGDSDGDFLRLAKEQSYFFAIKDKCEEINKDLIAPSKPDGELVFHSPEGFDYKKISEEAFYSMELLWDELIAKSDASPLFMSWQWIVSWWRQWGHALSLQLHVLLVFEQEVIVGIIPFYQYKKRFLKKYQMIGNAWGLSPTVRSEYTSPIFLRDKTDALYKSLNAYIKAQAFNSSFIFSDTLKNAMPTLSCWEHRMDVGYKISVSGDFNDYLLSLGRMTRLKAFNRRMYVIEHYPSVEFQWLIITRESLDDFFNNLNSFHLLRWGKPCFDRFAVNFHKSFLLGPMGPNALLSYLRVDGKIVSASYNIKIQDVIYNIQSGYLELFDKKVSLGTLHMGWLIETAFKNQSVNAFDFLAGFGRVEDYKKHYRGDAIHFYTFQYFSSSTVRALFGAQFVLKKLTKKTAKYIKQAWGGGR